MLLPSWHIYYMAGPACRIWLCELDTRRTRAFLEMSLFSALMPLWFSILPHLQLRDGYLSRYQPSIWRLMAPHGRPDLPPRSSLKLSIMGYQSPNKIRQSPPISETRAQKLSTPSTWPIVKGMSLIVCYEQYLYAFAGVSGRHEFELIMARSPKWATKILYC